MARIKYAVKENKKTGTHSCYAAPVFNGTLTQDEILEEALDGKSIEKSVVRAGLEEFMKAIQRNVKKGFRCQIAPDFLTVYPNISAKVKDYVDPKTGETVVATPDMVTAVNAKSRLGCTVHPKFSAQFAQEVSWQKVDASGAVVEEEDITQGNENVEGTSNGNPPSNGPDNQPTDGD